MTVLHVEQEVEGDDTPAIDSVLSCDTRRHTLLQEERDITSKLHSTRLATFTKITLLIFYQKFCFFVTFNSMGFDEATFVSQLFVACNYQQARKCDILCMYYSRQIRLLVEFVQPKTEQQPNIIITSLVYFSFTDVFVT